eukprot:scaffold13572_cov52-Phaeocystis_antarctica.AAC.2
MPCFSRYSRISCAVGMLPRARNSRQRSLEQAGLLFSPVGSLYARHQPRGGKKDQPVPRGEAASDTLAWR